MEIIIGRAMLIISGIMGIVPILFSADAVFVFTDIKTSKKTLQDIERKESLKPARFFGIKIDYRFLVKQGIQISGNLFFIKFLTNYTKFDHTVADLFIPFGTKFRFLSKNLLLLCLRT